MPLISVILPVYNGETYLAEAIDSILAQTLRDFELIIVDDGSTDGSAQIIRAYAQHEPRIRSVKLEENVGLGAARNHGIAVARGKYLTFIDCDDVSAPQRLELQAGYLDAHPEIGVLGTCGQLLLEDLSTVIYVFRLPQQHAQIAFDMLAGVAIILSSIMLRLDDARAVGGYAKMRHGEDRDFSWRLLKDRRLKFANLPEQLYFYRKHGESLGAKRTAAHKAEQSEVYMRILRQLGNAAPAATMSRFRRLVAGEKFGWRERRTIKKDMLWLVDALLAQRLIDPADRPLLLRAVQHKYEGATPMRWQRWIRWRRKLGAFAANVQAGGGRAQHATAESSRV